MAKEEMARGKSDTRHQVIYVNVRCGQRSVANARGYLGLALKPIVLVYYDARTTEADKNQFDVQERIHTALLRWPLCSYSEGDSHRS